jgi:hypothetical protein
MAFQPSEQDHATLSFRISGIKLLLVMQLLVCCMKVVSAQMGAQVVSAQLLACCMEGICIVFVAC